MSSSAAPARRAIATPSPVATGGFVVSAKTWPAPPVASSVARARTDALDPGDVEEAAADDASLGEDEVGRAGERTDLDGLGPPRPLQERADHLPARGVAQRMQHPVARMRALAGEVKAARLAVEARAPGGELADPRRALLDQHPGRRRETMPAPALSVSSRCRSVSSSVAIATATPPWA